jgi:hypothetical protein
MTKIKQILKKENTFNGKTSVSFTGVMDDGITGYIDSKLAPNFKEGDEVDCKVEVHQNKQGKDYNILVLTKKQSAPEAKKFPPLPTTAQMTDAGSLKLKEMAFFKAADKVTDLVMSGKVPWEKYQESHTELCNYFFGAIDGLFSEK